MTVSLLICYLKIYEHLCLIIISSVGKSSFSGKLLAQDLCRFDVSNKNAYSQVTGKNTAEKPITFVVSEIFRDCCVHIHSFISRIYLVFLQ